MKIEFKDQSFIECKKSDTTNKIVIIIQAKDFENPLKKITNMVELTHEEFKQLIGDFI
tara:strand:- start:10266 stop:10439 length:174 start_codon:yes stop_codon:yes gene_type:complete